MIEHRSLSLNNRRSAFVAVGGYYGEVGSNSHSVSVVEAFDDECECEFDDEFLRSHDMTRAIAMVVGVCLAVLVAGGSRAAERAGVPSVSVNDPGATTTAGRHPGHEGHEYLSRSITMETGRTRYGIRYGACVDKAHGDKVVPS